MSDNTVLYTGGGKSAGKGVPGPQSQNQSQRGPQGQQPGRRVRVRMLADDEIAEIKATEAVQGAAAGADASLKSASQLAKEEAAQMAAIVEQQRQEAEAAEAAAAAAAEAEAKRRRAEAEKRARQERERRKAAADAAAAAAAAEAAQRRTKATPIHRIEPQSIPAPEPPKKKSMAWLWILIAVCVLAIGALVYFLGFNNDKKAAPQKTEIVDTRDPNAPDDNTDEAGKVIRGDYGAGAERQERLGEKYEEVQREVNDRIRQGNY